MVPWTKGRIRLVTHYGVERRDADKALQVFGRAIKELAGLGRRSISKKHPETHRLVTVGNGLDTLVVLPAPKRCDLNEGVSTHGNVAAFFSKTGLARCRTIKDDSSSES